MKALAPHMGATRFTRWIVKSSELPLRWDEALKAAIPPNRAEFAVRVREHPVAGTAAGERQLKLGHEVSNMLSDYPSSPPPLSGPLFLSALGKDLG